MHVSVKPPLSCAVAHTLQGHTQSSHTPARSVTGRRRSTPNPAWPVGRQAAPSAPGARARQAPFLPSPPLEAVLLTLPPALLEGQPVQRPAGAAAAAAPRTLLPAGAWAPGTRAQACAVRGPAAQCRPCCCGFCSPCARACSLELLSRASLQQLVAGEAARSGPPAGWSQPLLASAGAWQGGGGVAALRAGRQSAQTGHPRCRERRAQRPAAAGGGEAPAVAGAPAQRQLAHHPQVWRAAAAPTPA